MLNQKIGLKLKQLRKTRGQSLDEIAALTGVSKPMLSQIERGQSSPTVNVLWKIATGMKVPFSAFLEEPEDQIRLVDKEYTELITAENGMMRVYTLFSFDPVKNFEMFQLELDAGCVHESAPHMSGVEEIISVNQGELCMQVGGQKIVVKEKQLIRFKADIVHSYENPGSNVCLAENIIFY